MNGYLDSLCSIYDDAKQLRDAILNRASADAEDASPAATDRREAEIRKGARTSKTVRDAKRRGTIVTVLASLQTRISNFTLANVLAEIERWLQTGSSLLEQKLQSLQYPPRCQLQQGRRWVGTSMNIARVVRHSKHHR